MAIRRLARDREDVKIALFGSDSACQWSFGTTGDAPHREVNEHDEVVATISRKSFLHAFGTTYDLGGFDQRRDAERLAAVGVTSSSCGVPAVMVTCACPFCGSSDVATVSVMGANIYPEDIEQCLYHDTSLAEMTNSFCLCWPSPNGEPSTFHVRDLASRPSSRDASRQQSCPRLVELSADSARHGVAPRNARPEICFRLGRPFRGNAGRIKQCYPRLTNHANLTSSRCVVKLVIQVDRDRHAPARFLRAACGGAARKHRYSSWKSFGAGVARSQ